jgi:murein DD-endopeptidase MepM/ murein hydrolase activator NlpD
LPDRHECSNLAASRLLRAVVALALVVGMSLQAGPSRAQSYEERALQQARDRVASVEARLDRARGAAALATDRLTELQQDVAVLDRAVNQAADAVAQQEAQVARAGARLLELEAEANAVEQALESQVIALFKRGAMSRFETILASGDLKEAIQRAEFVQVLASGEAALLEGLTNARTQVTAQAERFAAQQSQLLSYQAEQDDLFARASAARDEAASILSGARNEVRSLERAQDVLESDAKALRELIRRNSAAPTSGLAPSRAGYIWPICGVVTSEYGRRWGRMHAGIDIDGDTGDVIAAAKAGLVIFAGRQGGYGNLVMIDHGDGVVTAYAHQSRIDVSEGANVVRGQKIGAVGNTGQSTGSHLHFETRVNGDADNPRRFLTSRC